MTVEERETPISPGDITKLSTNDSSPSSALDPTPSSVAAGAAFHQFRTISPLGLKAALERVEKREKNGEVMELEAEEREAGSVVKTAASIDSASLKALLDARAAASGVSSKATRSLERGSNLVALGDYTEGRQPGVTQGEFPIASKAPKEPSSREEIILEAPSITFSTESETFPQTIARLTPRNSVGAEEGSALQLSRINSLDVGVTQPNSLELTYMNESELSTRLAKKPTSQSYFTKAEITYQLQVSLALRVMAEAELAEEMEMPNQPVVEDFSDITPWPTPVVPRGQAEATAYRYWVNGILSYEDRIEDGFYDLCGISPYVWSLCMDPGQRGRMPPLDALKALHPSEVNFDVTLVNRTVDRELKALEDKAVDFAYAATDVQTLANQLAVLVAGHMGGSVESETEELIPMYQQQGWELKSYLKTIVVPIGHFSVGLCRHRALLFKVLADALGMPCRITRGCKHCNMDYGASCLVLCADETENVVDLIFHPGEMYPLEASHTSAFNPIASPLRCPVVKPSDSVSAADEVSWVPDFRRGDETESDINPRRLGRIRSRLSSNSLEGSDSSLPRGSSISEQSSTESLPRQARKPKLKGPPRRARIKEAEEEESVPPDQVKRNPRERLPREIRKKNLEEETGSNTPAPKDSNAQEKDEKKPSGDKKDAKGSSDKSSSKEGEETEGVDLSLLKNVIDVGELEIPWEQIELGERIGAGSFGTVHRAEWNGSDVAVKILINQDLQADQLDEFCREVAMMKRLRHPNIVLFMGAVTKPPHLSIVTEFLGRGSLFRLLHRPGAKDTLKEDKRMRMAMDVARGINYLHRCNPMIVHRDLKSPNLLVDKNWTVKVADFGLSKNKNNTFLSSKSGAGTPEWMAPEVLRNEVADEKSDVYSFGVILWELATLQQPWEGMNAVQVVGAVGFQNRRLQIPDEILPEVKSVIESCWEDDPTKRPNFAQIMTSLKPLQRFTASANNPKQSAS